MAALASVSLVQVDASALLNEHPTAHSIVAKRVGEVDRVMVDLLLMRVFRLLERNSSLFAQGVEEDLHQLC